MCGQDALTWRKMSVLQNMHVSVDKTLVCIRDATFNFYETCRADLFEIETN